MKKLLCFTLSAVLAAALAVPAFADTSVPPTSAPRPMSPRAAPIKRQRPLFSLRSTRPTP